MRFDENGIDVIPLCPTIHADYLRYTQAQDIVIKELAHMVAIEDSNSIRWGERFILRCLLEVEESIHIRFQLLRLQREPTRITYKDLFSWIK